MGECPQPRHISLSLYPVSSKTSGPHQQREISVSVVWSASEYNLMGRCWLAQSIIGLMSKYYPNRCNYNPGVLIMVNFPSHSIVNQVMYVVLLCDEYWHSPYCFRCDRIEKARDLEEALCCGSRAHTQPQWQHSVTEAMHDWMTWHYNLPGRTYSVSMTSEWIWRAWPSAKENQSLAESK